MRNAKVGPLTMSEESLAVLEVEDDGRWGRRGRDFWYARRAFLNSYHLSWERNDNNGGFSFKQKLRKSVKEVNQKAMAVVLDMRRGLSHRRLGVRAFRVTLSLPSLVLVTVKCFLPCMVQQHEGNHVNKF